MHKIEVTQDTFAVLVEHAAAERGNPTAEAVARVVREHPDCEMKGDIIVTVAESMFGALLSEIGGRS